MLVYEYHMIRDAPSQQRVLSSACFSFDKWVCDMKTYAVPSFVLVVPPFLRTVCIVDTCSLGLVYDVMALQ